MTVLQTLYAWTFIDTNKYYQDNAQYTFYTSTATVTNATNLYDANGNDWGTVENATCNFNSKYILSNPTNISTNSITFYSYVPASSSDPVMDPITPIK